MPGNDFVPNQVYIRLQYAEEELDTERARAEQDYIVFRCLLAREARLAERWRIACCFVLIVVGVWNLATVWTMYA